MPGLIRCACGGAVENCVRCSGSGMFKTAGNRSFVRSKVLAVPPPTIRKIWTTSFAEAAAEAAVQRNDLSRLRAKAAERHRFANDQVNCPFCKMKAARWEVWRHAEKKHKDRKFRNADCKILKRFGGTDESSKPVPSKDGRSTLRLAVANVDPLDATRHMGHFAREGARFGSHPIHDRFDDESGPS